MLLEDWQGNSSIICISIVKGDGCSPWWQILPLQVVDRNIKRKDVKPRLDPV